MPGFRHSSATDLPASCSFRIPLICSSLYRDRFIRPSPSGPDSNSSWLILRGARQHQSHLMPQLPDLTRPIMRRAASLNADQTRRWGLEERQYFRPLQVPPQYCLASCIDAMQLEDPLGDVQTDCGNLHGGRLLQFVALNGPSLAHRCRQGSSTASDLSPSRAQNIAALQLLARRLQTHLIAQAQPALAGQFTDADDTSLSRCSAAAAAPGRSS